MLKGMPFHLENKSKTSLDSLSWRWKIWFTRCQRSRGVSCGNAGMPVSPEPLPMIQYFSPGPYMALCSISKKLAGEGFSAAAGPFPSLFSPWQTLQFCENSSLPFCNDSSVGNTGTRSIIWHSSGALYFTASIDCVCSDISSAGWWCPCPLAKAERLVAINKRRRMQVIKRFDTWHYSECNLIGFPVNLYVCVWRIQLYSKCCAVLVTGRIWITFTWECLRITLSCRI